jgi:hypothetical protein
MIAKMEAWLGRSEANPGKSDVIAIAEYYDRTKA